MECEEGPLVAMHTKSGFMLVEIQQAARKLQI